MTVVANRFQFRLRSLVWVVTAYCLWLGMQVGYVGRREVAAGEVWGWLLVCVVWSLLAAMVGWIAGRQGRSVVVWFIVALVANPLVAWLGMVFVKEVGEYRQRGHVLSGRPAGEEVRARDQSER